LSAVIVDDRGSADSRDDAFDTLFPAALGIDARELHRRAMLFDAQGLISSLRPLAIAHALDRGAKSVLLLDADVLVLAPLSDLWRAARRAGVLLSPHSLRPLAAGADGWLERAYLRDGTFNGGLLGVGRRGRPFLDWIAPRIARECGRDPSRGLFYSQTWLNLVPVLFEHRVLADPGLNVTVNRLAGADLEGSSARPQVGGARLRLFHFAGFDPDAPDVLCRDLRDDLGRLEGRPRLAALCRAYAERLRARGWRGGADYGWSHLPGGLRLDDVMRAVYSGALLASEKGLCEEPPDPFDADDPGRFVDWLRDPPEDLSRYLLGVRELREDLRSAFVRVPGNQTAGFLGWAGAQAGAGAVSGPAGEIPAELATVRGRDDSPA
jgi:hypothetical protein